LPVVTLVSFLLNLLDRAIAFWRRRRGERARSFKGIKWTGGDRDDRQT